MKMRNLVAIKLGNRCNLRCEYCVQKNMDRSVDFTYKPDILIPKVISTIKNDFNNDSFIFFVGGETLLYMDIVRDIVRRMKDYNEWNSKYILYTNGYYLTNEFVDYFNENNFEVYVSWDGNSSKITRGYNIFDDVEKINIIKRINNLYITTLLTNDSLLIDKFDVLNPFNKEYLKVHGYNINIVFRIVSSYYYTPDNIKKLKSEIELIKTTRYTKILESKFLNGDCKPFHRNMISYTCDGKSIRSPSTEYTDLKYIFCKQCSAREHCVSHIFFKHKSMYCYLCRLLYSV